MMYLCYLAVFLCGVGLVALALPNTGESLGRMATVPAAQWVAGAPALPTRRRLLTPILQSLGRVTIRSSQRVESLEGRLVYVRSRLSPQEFGGVQILAAAAGLATSTMLLVEAGRVNLLWIFLGSMLGFLAPSVWLRSRIAKRHKAIVRLLPEIIDLLSLCVGAGLDFLGGLNKILLLKWFHREPLVEEFSIVVQEIQLGKRRTEALRAMAKRINLPELSSFIRTLVQADRMGTPIEETLTIHADDVRSQRFTRAERAALRAPIKILIPLIFCIMPCVALIVGGPVFIQFTKQNPFSAIGGQ